MVGAPGPGARPGLAGVSSLGARTVRGGDYPSGWRTRASELQPGLPAACQHHFTRTATASPTRPVPGPIGTPGTEREARRCCRKAPGWARGGCPSGLRGVVPQAHSEAPRATSRSLGGNEV